MTTCKKCNQATKLETFEHCEGCGGCEKCCDGEYFRQCEDDTINFLGGDGYEDEEIPNR